MTSEHLGLRLKTAWSLANLTNTLLHFMCVYFISHRYSRGLKVYRKTWVFCHFLLYVCSEKPQHSEEVTDGIPASVISRLLDSCVAAAANCDKIKDNTVRAIGNLVRMISDSLVGEFCIFFPRNSICHFLQSLTVHSKPNVLPMIIGFVVTCRIKFQVFISGIIYCEHKI